MDNHDFHELRFFVYCRPLSNPNLWFNMTHKYKNNREETVTGKLDLIVVFESWSEWTNYTYVGNKKKMTRVSWGGVHLLMEFYFLSKQTVPRWFFSPLGMASRKVQNGGPYEWVLLTELGLNKAQKETITHALNLLGMVCTPKSQIS